MVSSRKTILLTIDVEDWFQVENFKQCIPFSSWSSRELRVEQNTHRLLDLLDSIKVNQVNRRSSGSNWTQLDGSSSEAVLKRSGPQAKRSKAKPRATFFVLGWIAERLPHLVREIGNRGHEVASHGFHHELCNKQSRADLKQDLMDSKNLLEDTVGNQVYGYRAPSFSIDDDSLKLIQECGYLYDSSYNSFGLNNRYGKLTISRNGSHLKQSGPQGRSPVLTPTAAEGFYELSISNLEFKTKNSKLKIIFPWGGGGYFRLIPFFLFKRGVESILKKDGAYIFYMHPWEIDPDQPRVEDASWFYKFRHYTNLGSTRQKVSRLISEFKDCEFLTCSQYLGRVASSEAVLKGLARS